MKFLPAQFAYLLRSRESRQNLTGLFKYLAILAATIGLFTVLFHVIMEREGQHHSWLTGLYWTLTVMTTLGFGDVTFHSDMGRFFSLVVLLTGVLGLLIVLPFTFIQSFYAPWLEAQLRLRAPRQVDPKLSGHVLFCSTDAVSSEFTRYLDELQIPHVHIEPDQTVAARLHSDGVGVITGDVDDSATYRAAGVSRARLVLANLGDAVNTNITLTVREISEDVPVVAIAEHWASVDLLELAGATQVIPLKHRLGQRLAARVMVDGLFELGYYRDIALAELSIKGSEFDGKRLKEVAFAAGTRVVGVFQRGKLSLPDPALVLNPSHVLLIAGPRAEMARLDTETVARPQGRVIVIGGGKVGRAALRAFRDYGVETSVVEADATLRERLEKLAGRVVIGDASDRDCLAEAGLVEASGVVVTTNDDATNIYLSVYCRKLVPELRIVCRVTHSRNVVAVYRAGADFALRFATLGVRNLLSRIDDRDVIMFGEGVDLHPLVIPSGLIGRTLGETGLLGGDVCVVGIQRGPSVSTDTVPTLRLRAGDALLVACSSEQFDALCARAASAESKRA